MGAGGAAALALRAICSESTSGVSEGAIIEFGLGGLPVLGPDMKEETHVGTAEPWLSP